MWTSENNPQVPETDDTSAFVYPAQAEERKSLGYYTWKIIRGIAWFLLILIVLSFGKIIGAVSRDFANIYWDRAPALWSKPVTSSSPVDPKTYQYDVLLREINRHLPMELEYMVYQRAYKDHDTLVNVYQLKPGAVVDTTVLKAVKLPELCGSYKPIFRDHLFKAILFVYRSDTGMQSTILYPSECGF